MSRQHSIAIPNPVAVSSDRSHSLPSDHKQFEPDLDVSGVLPPSDQHDECQLLRLPPDLRNQIYDLSFHIPNGVHIDFSNREHRSVPQHIFALSSTCRQIHDECNDLPYWLNTFHFHAPVLEEPVELAIRSRTYRGSTPIVLPLPQVVEKHYRKRHIPCATSASLVSPDRKLREKAQQFITLAMRLPHVDAIVSRLEETVNQPAMSRLRRVHVHLGSQTRHPFIDRFFFAWRQVVPALLMLSTRTELRISFELRISKRLSVVYEFGVKDADTTLAEMDSCVKAEDFTLSELATLNGVRVRVWDVFFGTESARSPAPFRVDVDIERGSGTYRSCGIAVLDRIAFGTDMELRA